MAPIRAVIFDLGHTLWDYAPTEQARRLSTLQLHARLTDELAGATPHPQELDRGLLRLLERLISDWYADGSSLEQPPSDAFIRRALTALEGPVSEDLVADMTQILFGSDFDVPVILPDTLAAIGTLHAQGIAMGCITNTIALPSAIDDLLWRLGLLRYLNVSVASSGAGFRKPHSSLFQHALEELDVPSEETLFVGDRLLDDVSGAKALGMRAVLTHQYRQEPVLNTSVRPDAVISRLSDLPAVVQRLSKQ